jgi:hypothetical protein
VFTGSSNFIKIIGNSKFLLEKPVKCRVASVYYKVYEQSPPTQDLYVVDFLRHPGDLGVSVVLQATCELMARSEVLRLYPEYKHDLVLMRVYLAQYAEIDWDNGRSIVVKQEKRPRIPACIAAKAKSKRPKLPRLEDDGGVQ